MSRSISGNAPHGNSSTATTHSRENALDEREFELLLEGCHALDDDYHALEARLVALVAGRLGLRAGELCHMDESWIDWRRRMIVIPRYHDCQKGRGGDVCGYCRQHAKQRVEYNEDVDLATALEESWRAKTDAAAREVPFDGSPRSELVIERYFDRFDEFTVSRTGVNRRVDAALEAAEGLDSDTTNPHGLRATAASYFASRGLNVIALQSMFGWANLSTAHNYIRRSGENTARAIRDIKP